MNIDDEIISNMWDLYIIFVKDCISIEIFGFKLINVYPLYFLMSFCMNV